LGAGSAVGRDEVTGDTQNPVTRAAIAAINTLDGQLVAANSAVQTAAELHTQDQQTIQDLQTKLAKAQQPAPSAQQKPNLLDYILSPTLVTVAVDLHLAPFVTDPNARPLMQWFQPGPTGNSSPNPADPHGTWDAAITGAVRTITTRPAGPFNNYFFGLNVRQGPSAATKYWQLKIFEVPDESAPLSMGQETNLEHSIAGKRFNGGLQILSGTDKEAGKLVSNVVRYYDISAGGWHTLPTIPMPKLGTGNLVTVVNEFQRIDAGMHFLTTTINGTRYVVDKVTAPKATTWGEYLQHGYQMDTLASGKGYSTKLYDTQLMWA
jgi:hypothetical protein